MENDIPAVSALRTRGNTFAREGNYIDAVQEYTKAVRLNPRDPILYSNRSHAFLKLGQHFYALKDAETAIRLSPEWQKGYYRKGQVELDAEEYEMAINTFNQGILINPCDDGLRRALENAEKEALKHKRKRANRSKRFSILFGLTAVIIFAVDNYLKLNYIPIKSSWIVIFVSTILGYLVAHLFVRKTDKLHPPVEVLRQMQEELKELSNPKRPDSSVAEHSYME